MTGPEESQVRHLRFVIDSAFDIRASSFKSHRFFANLFGANAYCVFYRENENLAVTDFTGLGGPNHFADRFFDHIIGQNNLDLHFGEEIDRILAAAIDLGVAFLPSESFDFGDRHSLDTKLGQSFFNLLEFERLNDRFQLFHLV